MPKLAGRYAFLEQLVTDGVTHVFGNPGTTEQAFIDALQDYPQLRYILALHESVAVGIAVSFGVKGVRIEHADQIGDAVREAQMAQEPRVVDIVIDGDISSRWL
jgi:thiamine pyrophosphate-dependent acetolactate synthase large subunit-like protein